jgi:hypothetical protein
LSAEPQDPVGNGQQGTPAPSAKSYLLNVTVIAGRGAANVLRPASAIPPVVEVRDVDNHPVIGAVVTFSAPLEEPTVTFPNGNRSYSVVTDTSGQAAVESMIPLGVGSFSIEVSAAYDDDHGATTIPEANYTTLKAATSAGALTRGNRVEVASDHSLSTSAKVGIVGVVAAAAGVGLFFGLRGHGSSSSSISVGTPTVGAPH